MTGTGSSSAFKASEAKSLSIQFPAPESVNPPDECPFSCQTEQTQPLSDEDPCYFCACGERDRQRIEERG